MVFSFIISGIVLVLFFYVFVVADRTQIFLYNHLTFTPQDYTTQSRYFMAGLVISGFVFVVYLLLRLLVRKPINSRSLLKQITLPISIGILYITLVLGRPTISLPFAVATVASTLIGLTLSFYTAEYLFCQRLQSFRVLPAIIGLVPLLTLFHAVEFYGHLPSITLTRALFVSLGTVGFALVVLGLSNFFFRHKKIYFPATMPSFALSLWVAYVLMPLVHFLQTPFSSKYFTTADNFLAKNPFLQLIILITAFSILSLSYRSYPSK